MSDDATLSELQTWMAELLRRRRALPKDSALAQMARRHVAGNDRLSPVEQLEIYRRQFWLRHTSSLIEDFPGVGGIVGQDDWERLIEEYLDHHPSQSHSLRDLGNRLAEHIEGAEWLPHRDLCADMARLEWSYIEVFDAADSAPLDPAELGGIPEAAWERARLVLAPALRLLPLRYPVAELRRRLRAGSEPVSLPEPQAQWLVVYRLERELYDRRLSRGAFALLGALGEGTPLVAACERAMAEVPEEAADIEARLGDWFRLWAELGWIVAVRHE